MKTTLSPTSSKVPPPSSGSQTRKRPRQPRARNLFRKVIPWIIGATILFGIVSGFRPKTVDVETGVIAPGPLSVSVLEEGKTRIRHRYTVSPPVSGYLQRVPLRAGAPIEAGKTILATIQAEPASLLNPRTQSEAEARVRAAEATLSQREADLERARATAALAEKEKQRAIPLHRTGAISAREWDAAEMEAAVRGREMRASEFALQVAKFELQQAQSALLQVKSLATNDPPGEPFQITAPVDGYVLNVFEESARILAAGTPIMEVGNPTDLEAEIELLSTDAAAVKPGAEVAIERWGGPTPLRGKVTLVEPAAFTKISALGVEEQRVRVRVDFVDPLPRDYPLGDRYRVEARIITWSASNVLQIPTGALFRRGADWMCFVLDGGEARLQKVEIGRNNGIAAEVIAGVSKDERVILHPPDVVAAGTSVRPRKEL